MTKAQLLAEIHKELAVNSRLVHLLMEFGEHYANAALRKTYSTNEPALLIRQAGMAEGVERFISELTKASKSAHPDRE